jgi:hypothetical protein
LTTEWRGIVQTPQIISSDTGSYSHFLLRMADGKQIEVDYTPATNLQQGAEIIARGEYNIPDNRLTASSIQIVPTAPVVFRTSFLRTIALAVAAVVLFVILVATEVPLFWAYLFTFVTAVLLARYLRGNYPSYKVWVTGAISFVIAFVLFQWGFKEGIFRRLPSYTGIHHYHLGAAALHSAPSTPKGPGRACRSQA